MTDHAGGLYTVIYDGHCGVCTRLSTRLAALDKRRVFEIIPSQLPEVLARFPWIPPKAYSESLQLVRNSDQRRWQGAAAVEEIVNALHSGWIVSWIFAIPFARPIAERLYRWFADHRNELGCGVHCQVGAAPSVTDGKNS
ncbi:MAG TPA: DCC1-like thiol-disulfide oxidoreductase family protein [Gemmatimonadaceae bacterium]